jgi:GT2 family glycosyltransferase
MIVPSTMTSTDERSGQVTVVIPAWNLDRELRDSVTSVQEQERVARVIVVDNASEFLLPSFADVEVVTLSRRVSVGAARNAGLQRACTQYVLFMEGDDLLLPGAVACLLPALEARRDAVAVAGRVLAWNPTTGARAPTRWPFAYAYRLCRYSRVFALWNCVRNVFPTVGPVIIRTDAARRAGGFADGNWAEDWAFGAALAFQGGIVMEERVCGLYRINAARVTLSDLKERRFWPSWQGRARVRRQLQQNSTIPLLVRRATPLLIPFHLWYTLQDLLLARQRV